jgi:hypothetical protein
MLQFLSCYADQTTVNKNAIIACFINLNLVSIKKNLTAI